MGISFKFKKNRIPQKINVFIRIKTSVINKKPFLNISPNYFKKFNTCKNSRNKKSKVSKNVF